MPTLLEDEQRNALLSRFQQLQPDDPAKWGSLTAARMVCHLSDQLRVAVGDLKTQDRGNLVTKSLAKWIVIYLLNAPPKAKIKTSPEMLSTQSTSWTADKAAFERLVMRLVDTSEVSPHPKFGQLSQEQWCILAAKHIDYHLRQFGR